VLIREEYGQASGLTGQRDSVSVVREALGEIVTGHGPCDAGCAVLDDALAAHVENLARRVADFADHGWSDQVRLSPYLIALREALEANRSGG
jgi:hypothetical protein